MHNLQLLTTKQFNGATLDCYVEQGQEHTGDFWATREQIGRLLGYDNPKDAIKKIHKRNQERLDKFSKSVNMRTLFNEGQNVPPFRNSPIATVYNFKGLLEICRYSNQPNANQVIDKLWEIADEIRRTGVYMTDSIIEQLKNNPEAFNLLLNRYVAETKKNSKLQKKLDEQMPLATLGKTVLALTGSITIGDAAHLLAQKGIDIGQNRLYKWSRDNGLLCKRKGKQWNQPTQKAIEKGLLNAQIDGGFRVVAMVTPQGLLYLSNIFTEQQLPIIALIEAQQAGND